MFHLSRKQGFLVMRQLPSLDLGNVLCQQLPLCDVHLRSRISDNRVDRTSTCETESELRGQAENICLSFALQPGGGYANLRLLEMQQLPRDEIVASIESFLDNLAKIFDRHKLTNSWHTAHPNRFAAPAVYLQACVPAPIASASAWFRWGQHPEYDVPADSIQS